MEVEGLGGPGNHDLDPHARILEAQKLVTERKDHIGQPRAVVPLDERDANDSTEPPARRV